MKLLEVESGTCPSAAYLARVVVDRWQVAPLVDRVAHVHRRRVSVAMTTGIIPQHQQPTPAICHSVRLACGIICNIPLTVTHTRLIIRITAPWKRPVITTVCYPRCA